MSADGKCPTCGGFVLNCRPVPPHTEPACPLCGGIVDGERCLGYVQGCWQYPGRLAEAQRKVIACARALDRCLGEFGDTKVRGECLCVACGEYVQALSDAIAALGRLDGVERGPLDPSCVQTDQKNSQSREGT